MACPGIINCSKAQRSVQKKFICPHRFLWGRFVPPTMLSMDLTFLDILALLMSVRIGKPPSVNMASLRENYNSPELLEDQVMADPVDQVCISFDI